ncbi:hypothetical protein ECA02_33540 [Enterococcus casseliflavus]|nr:hypothetical protein ECA02_33540 [Enterococcus casseliflavus]
MTKKISDETQISPNQYIPKVPKRPQFTFSIKKAAIVVNEQRRKKRCRKLIAQNGLSG